MLILDHPRRGQSACPFPLLTSYFYIFLFYPSLHLYLVQKNFLNEQIFSSVGLLSFIVQLVITLAKKSLRDVSKKRECWSFRPENTRAFVI